MLRKIAVALATIGALGAVNLTPAVADDGAPPPEGNPVTSFTGGIIVAHGGEAYVTFTYTCHGGDTTGNHLFIAVKQGPRVNATDRTTSAFAKTFYSTNWSADSGPNVLNCDGDSHTQTVVLKNDPYWAGAETAPPLRSGPAFLQVCVFDQVTQFSQDGEPLDGGFGFDYSMQRVLAAGGRS